MKTANYSEAEVRNWLHWLASSMRKHAQTVFMVEQLQPAWLPSRQQMIVYLLLSRLLESSMLVLLDVWISRWIGLNDPAHETPVVVSILTFGLSAAIGEWFLKNTKRTATSITVFFLWMLGVTFACFYFVEDLFGMEINPFTAIVLAFRGIRGFEDDIHCTESVTWSWRDFLKGLYFRRIFNTAFNTRNAEAQELDTHGWSSPWIVWAARVGLAAYFSWLLSIIWDEVTTPTQGNWVDILEGLFIFLLPNGVSAFFSAISRRQIQTKIVVNEGLRRSIRNAVLFLVPSVITLAAIRFLLIKTTTLDQYALEWFILSLMLWLGIFSSAWFGGLDAISHYVLRGMLSRIGCAPMNYPRFLDYAAKELGFLQKVGGGYVFLHRYLMEYFASEDEAPLPEASNAISQLS